jgi:hypothetical protein
MRRYVDHAFPGGVRLFYKPERTVEVESLEAPAACDVRAQHVPDHAELIHRPFEVGVKQPGLIQPDEPHVPLEATTEGDGRSREEQQAVSNRLDGIPALRPLREAYGGTKRSERQRLSH